MQTKVGLLKLKTNLTEKTVHVNSKYKLLVQRVELDKRTTSVEISAQGQGFVLVDTSVKYNVMKSGDSTFEINTTLSSSKQTLDTITVNVCIRRKDDKDNGMVVAEVGLPCGFKADLSKTNAIGLDHKETSSDKVVLYFKNLKRNWVCFDVTGNRVDSVTESQGVPIIVYDYYEPGNYGIASYMTGLLQEMNICQVCPKCKICKNTVLG
ncbi:ovostatin-like [Crassostrea angulata]|uniref:ovostatin-like n=1 Tax=Magallana angulata TaxID=2784310 RepID=UPI0022B0E8F9|nr:ovostatin-like [Crassostrea angulata]